MQASVVISTYNSAEWLEKAIWGYAVQTCSDFELVIADDGSCQETILTIERLRRKTGLAIQHVWHEDRGFRKCQILNKAIVAARGDYLIFSDGDCIPRGDFVATHLRLSRPGCALSGGCVRLPMHLSRRIGLQEITGGRCADLRWLISHGWRPSREILKLQPSPRLAAWLEKLTSTRATFNGHNASAWKADVLRVNGFDERMQYGGLDRELGERLENAGVRFQQVRHRAVCLHLDHGRPYVNEDTWKRNRAIRDETRRTGRTWTPCGIEQGESRSAKRKAAA
jgi:glycosyltransferase involved in cell wall biosynthesis